MGMINAAQSIDELYSRNPGTMEIKAGPDATAGTATTTNANASLGTAAKATATDATSKGYMSESRELVDGDSSAFQLNKITSLDSPLMQRARQEGVMTAARRGLQNSSIAAGAAQGALVDRATPFALQDATTSFTQGRANQDSENQARQFGAAAENTASLQNAAQTTDVSKQNAALETDTSNRNAGLETDTSQLNATEANRTSALNASLQSDTSKFNAGLSQDRNIQDAAAENQMRQNVLQQNSELNKQFLAGQQSLDLATIQGQFQQLISTNETAASFYNGFFSSISSLMANSKDLSPERLAQLIRVNQDQLAAGLRLIDQINTVDFGTAIENPTVSGSPGGVVSTPAGVAPAADPRPNLETKLVGDTQLPVGYEVRATGKKGYYDVYDGGQQVGTLSPGGKNGRYRAK